MANWYLKYTASDIADWFDEQDQKYWSQHDDWIVQSMLNGETHPVFVFATWATDRINTAPQRLGSVAASGVMDLFRLGNDLDFSSTWGVAKGVFLNLMRIATIAGPAASALRWGGRYSGILATSALRDIEGSMGPCAYVGVNNLLSYLKGRTAQLFATVEDIVALNGADEGIAHSALLASDTVRAALAKFGVTWTELKGLRTIEDVLAAAKASDGPIQFSVKWLKANNAGASAAVDPFDRHLLTAVKDAFGNVRILDYVENSNGAFKGFGSLSELIAARPQWGPDFANVVLMEEGPVVAFSSRYLRLLRFGDGTFHFGVPIAMGLKWLKGATTDDKMLEIGRSAWRYLKAKFGDEAPTPPVPTDPPRVLKALPLAGIPAAPPAPTVLEANASALGVAPLPPEAAAAPRIDWLTGVQYRLKYLGYYRGAAHGRNDGPTKAAVHAFQKHWFADSRQWDSIPGPITQAQLLSVLGW